MEHGDISSLLITSDTKTSVWNEKMDDRYCLEKETNRCNGIGCDIGPMCIAHYCYDLTVPLFLGTNAVAEQAVAEN